MKLYIEGNYPREGEVYKPLTAEEIAEKKANKKKNTKKEVQQLTLFGDE